MNQPTRIVHGLISRYFPELRGTEIDAFYRRITNYLEYGEYASGGYYIRVDEKLKRASLIVLRGGLAHELCHILEYIKLSPLLRNLDDQRCEVSRRYRIRKERATDLEVARRGLLREIIAINRWAWIQEGKWNPEIGLKPAELEALVKV